MKNVALVIARFAACSFMKFCWVFPIKKNKIVFQSYLGTKYNDNPRAISEELAKHEGLDIDWILDKGIVHPDYIRTVRPRSLASLYHLATAKVWVDNSRKKSYIRKRKGQFYIQTWHGGVCLKKVEGDAESELTKLYIKAARNDSKMADLFISACEWRSRKYRTAFWYNGEILKCGLPRNEIFHQDSKMIKQKVTNYYSLSGDVNIILYAPTFRGKNRTDAYAIDSESVLNAYINKYGGNWVMLIRLHPVAAHLDSNIRYSDKVLSATQYGDINELLVASNVLLSDYSGCLFDAFRLRKETIIYAADLEEYLKQDRSLYFDITSLPAPVANNDDELIEIINRFDVQEYYRRIDEFESGIGYYQDDNATKEVCLRILHEIKAEG